MKDTKKLLLEAGHWRCPHGHNGLVHPACWERFVESTADEFRVGYFDIEATNLKADFGIMLSYAFKVRGKDKIYSNVIQQKDINSLKLDKPLVAQCLEDMKRFDMIVTYYGCLTPEARVLTSDLHWIPVGKLQVGDKLLSFTDNQKEGQRRKWTEAVVEGNERRQTEVFEVELSDGTKIKTTADHPWLVCEGSGYRWMKTENLEHYANKSTKIRRLIEPWSNWSSESDSWLAGIIDGEGSVSFVDRGEKSYNPNGHRFSITIAQNKGEILDEIVRKLKGLNVTFSVHNKKGTNGMTIEITGSVSDKLRFLGQIRPLKMKNLAPEKLHSIWENREPLSVVSVKAIGKQEIVALGTSSGTYIAEGFGMHNTGYDLPFTRTRAMKWGLDFPEYGALIHHDLYYVARAKLSLSRKSLENVGKLIGVPDIKNHLDADIWTQALISPKARAYILDHNQRDVILLEKAHDRLMPYVKGIRRSV